MSVQPVRCAAPDDDQPVRAARDWTRDKLAVLEYYLPGFTTATKGAPECYFVDGLAGSGVNFVRPSGERVCGSALLALHTSPPFTRCLLLDRSRKNVEALRARTAAFANRAIVEHGDVNRDLLKLMRKYINPAAPTLCLLDQEGLDVDWRTIRGLADFRTRTGKVELLILFDADGLLRVLSRSDSASEARLARFFGGRDWKQVHDEVVAGNLHGEAAQTEYVRLYEQKLRHLGYDTTLHRPIRYGGPTGKVMYWLIFATTHTAGKEIMDYAFQRAFRSGITFTLPGVPPARPRRSRSGR